jgi:hypothetical protein
MYRILDGQALDLWGLTPRERLFLADATPRARRTGARARILAARDGGL